MTNSAETLETKEEIKEIKTRNTDKKRIEKLEEDMRAIKHMLHSMKNALGLPESILPKLD